MNSPKKATIPIEFKVDPLKITKPKLISEFPSIEKNIGKKMSNIKRTLDIFYDSIINPRKVIKETESTVHPCLALYEKEKLSRFKEFEVKL